MKFAFNKELHDKVIENAICQDKQYELNEHIKELNKEIEMLKEENEEQKRINIDVVTQNKKLITVINMRNENLAMLNEEMEMYMMMYDKEKGEHHNTNQALQALENRYYSELEEREKKEKEKKEEQNVNSNNYNNNNNNNDVQVNKDEIEHKTDETTKNATIVVDTPQQQKQVKEWKNLNSYFRCFFFFSYKSSPFDVFFYRGTINRLRFIYGCNVYGKVRKIGIFMKC